MANAVVSRLGQVNATGDALAIFLKKFAGEVYSVYHNKTVMMDKVTTRSVKEGKSVSFPIIGRNTAAYHTPGTEIVGKQVKHAEVIVTLDALLVSDVFIANIDEAMNHYDIRGPYTTACGEALAAETDKNALRQVVLAARSANVITGEDGGSTIYAVDPTSGASPAENAAILYNGIKAAAQTLVEKNVDPMKAYCVMRPAEYFLLLEHLDLLNRDYGGYGSITKGDLPTICGITLVMSNNFEKGTNVTGTYSNKYNVNMTNTVAAVWTPEAVGLAKLIEVAVEGAYDIRRQGHLIVAKQAQGLGTLRCENALEITAATAP